MFLLCLTVSQVLERVLDAPLLLLLGFSLDRCGRQGR